MDATETADTMMSDAGVDEAKTAPADDVEVMDLKTAQSLTDIQDQPAAMQDGPASTTSRRLASPHPMPATTTDTVAVRSEPPGQSAQYQQTPATGVVAGLHQGLISASETTAPTPRLPQLAEPVAVAYQKPQLGGLHKRRASVSPEKFNSGKFEPLPIRTESAVKRSRVEQSSGQVASPEAPVQSTTLTAGLDAFTFAASPTFPNLVAAHPSNIRQTSAILLNKPYSKAKKTSFFLLSAFCKDNDLLLLLVSYLNIPTIINLYAMSKPFHFLFNSHQTAYILSCMRTWAPNADRIFPWRCYQALCIKDPYNRQKSKWVGKGGFIESEYEDQRDVPSLRWLQMVIYREGICRDMLIQLALKSLRCPNGTSDALKRMWFMLDLPLNAFRIALIRTPSYITDRTLTLLTHFFLKVDMHFTDPIGELYVNNHPIQRLNPNAWAGGAFIGVELREVLIAEKSLTPLWRVLRGWSWDSDQEQNPMTRLDMLRLWIRHKWKIPAGLPESIKQMTVMGVLPSEVGTAGLERIGVPHHSLTDKEKDPSMDTTARPLNPVTLSNDRFYPHVSRLIVPALMRKRERLLRPDQLVMMEGIRRKMGLHREWVKMMCWGFVDLVGRPLPTYTEEEMKRLARNRTAKQPVRKDGNASEFEAESAPANAADAADL